MHPPHPLLPQSELVHTDVIKLKAEGSTTDGLDGLQLHTMGRNPRSLTSRQATSLRPHEGQGWWPTPFTKRSLLCLC